MTVETFEIRKRGPYEGGEQFGEGGAYERIDALVRFAVQPDHALNQGVTDLELAPRDAGGRVTFEADVVVLRPMDSARGNGRLLTSVVNRGRTALLPFSHPPAGMDMTLSERIQPGDAFLLRHGWTVLLCGWQWDVTRRPGLLGIDAPIATEEGVPASTRVTVQFQPLTNRPSEYLGHWPSHPTFHEERVHTAYPAADVTDSEAVLTVREHQASQLTTVARDQYRFARVAVDGSETTEATWVTMEGGFVAGLVYELTYRTNRCPVAGTGLLAIRDAASFLRFGASEVNPCAGEIRHAYTHGVSQTGRFLREFVRGGFNIDEERRQVFDGVFVQVAGARTGEFNFRGAQPSVQYVHGPAFEPPFTYVPTSETPATILDEQRRRGGVPYIFEVNTANEYWRSDGFLVHADPLGEGDLDGEAGTRTYMMAGCQHGAGMPVLIHRSPLSPEQRVGNLMGTLAYQNLTRAALVNLAEWAEQGNAPPPQTTPTLTAETAKPRAAVLEQIRRIPGAYTIAPETLTELKRQTDGRSHPAFVSAVDVDGNEVAGIRLPEIQVPVSTYAGWNVRHEENGGIGQMSDMVGSTIPFPRTVAERLASGDPRLSIEERYRDRDHYVQLVRTAAEGLVRERFILVEDLERAVANAARLYDRVMEQ